VDFFDDFMCDDDDDECVSVWVFLMILCDECVCVDF